MQNISTNTDSLEDNFTDNKFKYILTRALIYGSIFTLGINLFSPIYADNLLKTLFAFIIQFIFYTLTIGILFSYGDWKVRKADQNSKKSNETICRT